MTIDLQKLEQKFDALLNDPNFVTDFEQWLEARRSSQHDAKLAVIGRASTNLNYMKNQIYRVQLTDESKLEFYVCSTNEINPHRNIKELGVCVLGKVIQLDGDLDLSELDSLISYLQDCREYIKEYNENSKPSEVVS